MGLSFSVYVGPYLETSDEFLKEDFEDIISEVRVESHRVGKPMYFVPNKKIDGIDRQLWFSTDREYKVLNMNSHDPVGEKMDFLYAISEVTEHLDSKGIEYHIRWGIIPDYS